ncbi:outer membrane beta-barrel protein [Phenylobacterium sp.]|uniref:outer membrane beta-barrel protein n=1 Tax=Phenylobacterium sp. TaxID=1871053 RepID=UPI00272F50E3|nr:outer membrane beta-barrel protein [Phenylobacterium sp.]MDP1598220.1 outer membrane beta-barrel protein [Phenylobacterium sp.]MDP3594716.1 outer membrane beta-barrel protein [Phenylobacterium sp.]
MVYGRLAAGVLIGAAVMSSPAAAQQARKVSVGLHAEVEHDSNVSRSSDLRASTLGLKPGDTIFTPSANVDLFIPVGRQSVFLTGSAGYSFYDQNKKLDRERLDFTGGVNAGIGPCSTTLSSSYNRGLSQIDDPTLVSTVENIQQTTRVQAQLGCSRPTGLGVVFTASHDWTANNLDFLKQSDYQNSSLMGGLTYQRPALGTLTLFANYQKTEYADRIGSDGYEMTSVGATFQRQLGARLQGTVTVALANVDQLGGFPGLADTSSETTTYDAGLSFRASDRLNFEASLDRAVTPSTGLGRTFDLSTGYRVSGEYKLGSRISIGAGVGRVERESEGGLLQPIIALTNSNTDTIFASVRYRQSERLSFALNARREERTANAPQFEYTSNRIGIAADVSF